MPDMRPTPGHPEAGRVPRIVLAGLALAAYVIVHIAVKTAVGVKNQDTWVAAFSTEMDRYLSLAGSPSSDKAPYLRGKLVAIDVAAREVDGWIQPKLSDELRADSPDETGTAVLIAWDWTQVGAYVDKDTGRETGAGYRSAADVTLVDVAEGRVIERRRFEGEMPASGQSQEGDYRSERPMFKIVKYLEGLPKL
jgi:hypothetical protein